MKTVSVMARVGGHTLELGSATLGVDGATAWLELDPELLKAVLRRVVAPPAVVAPAVVAPPAVELAPSNIEHLERMAERSRKVLADPKKAKWHPQMQAQLECILEELDRLQGRPRVGVASPDHGARSQAHSD